MQLWRSFLWFVGLMISLQSELLVKPLVLQELRELYANIDEHFASVLERKYVDRALDMAFRGRSKESATMWLDMYGKAAVAAPQLAAWTVLDACFRYLGSRAAIDGALFACSSTEVERVFSEGVTVENPQKITSLLRKGFFGIGACAHGARRTSTKATAAN